MKPIHCLFCNKIVHYHYGCSMTYPGLVCIYFFLMPVKGTHKLQLIFIEKGENHVQGMSLVKRD
jgi:hypothetical protein